MVKKQIRFGIEKGLDSIVLGTCVCVAVCLIYSSSCVAKNSFNLK